MVGLGQAVGAGGDMVLFGVVGLSGGAEARVCIHLEATFDATDELSADAGDLCG